MKGPRIYQNLDHKDPFIDWIETQNYEGEITNLKKLDDMFKDMR